MIHQRTATEYDNQAFNRILLSKLTMFCKYILVYFCLISTTSGDRSFTIVLDTTNSMQEELDVIKANLGPVLYAVSNRTNIADYIIVPFNEEIQQPVLSRTPRDLLAWLNTVTVSGGGKCPENSLAGIERALQISKPQSYIYLFTDAFSKDPHRLGSIQNLCKTSNTQVIIFLSGYCLPSPTSPLGNVNVYYDIASSCSGAVLRFEPNLRQAFKSMMALTEMEWTDVSNYGYFEDYKQFSFTVDTFTKNIIITVSGEDPIINITKEDGHNQQTEKLVESRYTQILSMTATDTGDMTVSIRCRNLTSATLFVRRDLPIQFGFSTKLPRHLSETARRPMPGMTNYVLIHITQDTLELRTVEIQVMDEETKRKINAEEISDTGFYRATFFFEPDKSFRIWIKCYDILSHNEVTGPTRYVSPQKAVTDTRWIKPTSEIIELDSVTVDYGTNRVVACKVNGYPKPNIWWEDSNQILPSEHVLLEIPSVYISYITIVNVTENATIYCKSQNSEGEHSQSVNIIVYRPYFFQIIRTPSDKTIEYGGESTLICKVDAYPEAEIKWYYNNNLLTQFNDLQITVEDGVLRITNMTLYNVGNYQCVVNNGVNNVTYSAFVNISGIEKPKIEIDNSEIVFKLGDLSYLECRVTKGKPIPTITWQYKAENDFDFGDIPDGVETSDGKLKIVSVQTNHKGMYRCEAANVEGTDSADITVNLRYPPIIANSSTHSIVVREGTDVALTCDARGAPAPRVRWELRRGDSRLPLNVAHTGNTQHTYRFNALWNNSGDYHCIAENELGGDEITITVNVLVPVYIEPPKLKTLVLRAGASVVLNCNVLFGNPVPSTKWKFIALDSTTTVISRATSTVHLENVTRANEGSYLCIAENEVSTDSIKIDVKVQ